MQLDKKVFYTQLKQFENTRLPIYVSMFIEPNSKYKINLSEDRITSMKMDFSPNFTLQIVDTSKTGYQKYVCNDINFNLIDENIKTDYQLYKFINSLINKYINKE